MKGTELVDALSVVHYRKDEPIETLRQVLGGGRL